MKSKINYWKQGKILITCLLTLDLILVLFNILYIKGVVSDPSFILWQEASSGGFGEWFENFKYVLVILFFVTVGIRKSRTAYLLWALVFICLLLDNYFMGHEQIGEYLSKILSIDSFLIFKPQEAGELIVYSWLGALVLIVLFLTQKEFGDQSWQIFGLILLMGFFGVGVDVIGATFKGTILSGTKFGIIEDGGELISLSFLVWYTYTYIFRFYSNGNK
jgi:hypothetical protein